MKLFKKKYTKEQLTEAFLKWNEDFVQAPEEFAKDPQKEDNLQEYAERQINNLLSYIK